MSNGDLIKLGTLYIGGTKQLRPTYPWDAGLTDLNSNAGNVPAYTTGQTIEIKDTDVDDTYVIQWREVTASGKKIYIADRNILQNVSWDDLNSQSLVFGKTITIDGIQYKARLLTGGTMYRNNVSSTYKSYGTPTNNEWDQIIINEGNYTGLPIPSSTDLDDTQDMLYDDTSSPHDQFWNWVGMYSWAQDTNSSNSALRAVRGYTSTSEWNSYTSSTVNSYVGYRPVLETLNDPPTISGNDSDLGNKWVSFTTDYTVNDTNTGDTLTITEKVDLTTIRTINNAVRNQTYSLDLTSQWSSLSLGQHSISITVDDGKGASTTRTYTFTKTEDRILFNLKNPIQTTDSTKQIVISGIVTVPTGATLNVFACNNGFDANPTWEDATLAFNNKEAYEFTNTAKSDVNWGIDVRFEMIKGASTTQPCIITGFGFTYE